MGKDNKRVGSVAESTVMSLIDGLLDYGRVLLTDNWYSSVPLAKKRISRKTHLVGTLRRNRKDLPPNLVDKKLKRGSLYALQNKKGITIIKWKDERDILMLSTFHDASTSDNGKPIVVEDYNQAKLFVDTSDQMASYTPFIRKTCKWYIRLFFHLLGWQG